MVYTEQPIKDLITELFRQREVTGLPIQQKEVVFVRQSFKY